MISHVVVFEYRIQKSAPIYLHLVAIVQFMSISYAADGKSNAINSLLFFTRCRLYEKGKNLMKMFICTYLLNEGFIFKLMKLLKN
jgi:hypothetical protein